MGEAELGGCRQSSLLGIPDGSVPALLCPLGARQAAQILSPKLAVTFYPLTTCTPPATSSLPSARSPENIVSSSINVTGSSCTEASPVHASLGSVCAGWDRPPVGLPLPLLRLLGLDREQAARSGAEAEAGSDRPGLSVTADAPGGPSVV